MVQSIEFEDRLDVGYGKKIGIENNFKVFVLNKGENRIEIELSQ